MVVLSPASELKIKGLKEISHILDALKANPEHASTTTSIVIDDEEDGEWENDRDSQATERMARSCESLVKIINIITLYDKLESFTWNGYEVFQSRLVRPGTFWEALAKLAPGLKHLNLGFYVHEIHELEGVNSFPSAFENLESLELDLGGGHGDDAVQIDRMLRKIHNLKRLALYLPTCDLENCRIRGLLWNYDFPKSQNLSLSIYDSQGSGLMDFLIRHSSVETLYVDFESDESTECSEAVFPNLGTLNVGTNTGPPFHGLLSGSRPISHLNAGQWNKNMYSEIAKMTGTLTCLETSDSFDAWREEEFPPKLKEILAQRTNLEEAALELPTGNTSWRNEDGTRDHPEKMNVEDLTRLFSCFPVDSKIRIVRMQDDRGLALPPEFLEDMTSIPESLEYISWKTDDGDLLYHLERKEGKIVAKLCGSLRSENKGCVGGWVDDSILKYLD